MKNAVLSVSCPEANRGDLNIGDYIQALAADQFMESSFCINREELDAYSGEDVKIVMNGWFMHRPSRFPPSRNIHPLFVSFHLAPAVADDFLTDKTLEYLRKHGPIGCRDESTVSLLESRGVPAYFTGCLTLTLGRKYGAAPGSLRKGVCFIDPFQPFKKKDFSRGRVWMLFHPLLTFSIYRRMKVQMLAGRPLAYRLRRFFRIGAFIRAYGRLFPKRLLASAEYFTHSLPESGFSSEEEKFEYARKLLRRYSTARFCVTSRIHCALPCVGMGTNVLFVLPEKRDIGNGRFDGLTRFFKLVEARRDALVARFRFDSPDGLVHEDVQLEPDRSFAPLADALAEKCRAFAAD